MSGRESTLTAYTQYCTAEADAEELARHARKDTHYALRKILGLSLALPGIMALTLSVIAMIIGYITDSFTATAAVVISGLIAIAGGITIQKADDALEEVGKTARDLTHTRRNNYVDAVADEVSAYGLTIYRIDYPAHIVHTDHGAIRATPPLSGSSPRILLNGEELIIPTY